MGGEIGMEVVETARASLTRSQWAAWHLENSLPAILESLGLWYWIGLLSAATMAMILAVVVLRG